VGRAAVELRHLRYFVTLSESLHFGQAASKLGIAQPSLSRQIQALEGELRTRLLRRTKRRVELTEAGRTFLDDAREILARADRAAMIARRAGGEATRLRVGVGHCMDGLEISRAVSLFNGMHEAARVELRTMAVPSQIGALRNELIDVGFVRPPVWEASLTCETLVREPLVAALPKAHRLATRKTMPLSALANELFILVPREAVPVYHDMVLEACREAGFVPNSPHEADQLEMIVEMVRAGTGVALVPAFVRRTKPRGLVFASLRPAPPELETAICWRNESASPLTAAFAGIARRVLAGRREGQ
jgi:DNA-binding transcriptional LysR family regulator